MMLEPSSLPTLLKYLFFVNEIFVLPNQLIVYKSNESISVHTVSTFTLQEYAFLYVKKFLTGNHLNNLLGEMIFQIIYKD